MPDRIKGLPVDSKITLDAAIYDLNEVYEALRIDETHVPDQLAEQASLYAFWSTLAEEAAVTAEVERRRLDYVEAELDEAIRADARQTREKITEKQIEKQITRDDKYQDRLDILIQARRDAAILGVVRRALEQRLSALIAINNRDRMEWSAGRSE